MRTLYSAKLSDGEQSDLVSTAVAVVPPQQGADGSQPPGVAAAIQQALVSDPAARATFRAEHPQMFRELCADIAQAQPDDSLRIAALKRIFTRLMREAILTPLFNYQYQVSAPPGVNGIRLNARGWFDFSEAWLPPDTR